jgi:DNA-binding PadR family transcriptional regulator
MWHMAERRSPLAMVVLSLLAEAPMHAYAMQQLIKFRRKDAVVNVAQRNSVYQAIERLLRDGYIQVRHTARDAGRPERTVYELTRSGREIHERWLRGMLSTPAREFPEFPAALAFIATLSAADARDALASRLSALEERLARLRTEQKMGEDMGLPRVFLLEGEYDEAMVRAELGFVRGLVSAFDKGELDWTPEWLAEMSRRFEGPLSPSRGRNGT